MTWLLSILFCGEAFGAEFDSEFNAHRKAAEQTEQAYEGGGEKTNILHTTIHSAFSAIATGRHSAGRVDQDLKKTLKILLKDPQIKQSINAVMADNSLFDLKSVYKKRETLLQMALYLPDSAALLLANGADAKASAPDFLLPVDLVLSRRTNSPAYHSGYLMHNDMNFEAFNLFLKHGKIDWSRIGAGEETTLEIIMRIVANFFNSSMSALQRAEQMQGSLMMECFPGSYCETQQTVRLMTDLYRSSSDDKRRGNQWEDLFFQLINDGFDLNLKNAKGQTILDRAITTRNKEKSYQLIDRFGASIDWEYTNNQGRTYLDLAIASGDEVLALKIIKTAGADMAYRNPEGESYLESAFRANFRKLFLFIARNGGFEGVEPDERKRLIALAARDLDHSFLREITRLSLSADKEGKPLMITGKIHNGTGGVGGNDGSGDESGGRRGPKFKQGPTRGEWEMIAGAAAGTGFSAIHGGGGFDILSSATFGAIALGFPLVFVDNCRFLFSHFRNKSASKPPVHLD